MARLTVEQIQAWAIEFISRHPEGIKTSSVLETFLQAHPDANPNTASTVIYSLSRERPEAVTKPERGVLKPSEKTVVQVSPPPPPTSVPEARFYESFARYLVDDLDEVVQARALGGGGIRGKWGTPDVVGVYRPKKSDLIQFSAEIVTAEIKVDPGASVVAFGQAVAYRLFSSKTYLVMPRTLAGEDRSRTESLCLLFGIGLVLFDPIPEKPSFEIFVRAQRFQPDMFYVNEFAKRLQDHNAGMFDELFG